MPAADDRDKRWADRAALAYAGAAVILVVVRQFYSAGLPVFVRGSTCDDRLMVAMTQGLLEGDWLGPYNGLTLMKGCFFPLFLSAVSACGLKYLSVLTAMHSAACLFFVRQVRPLLRSRLFDGLLLILLLFDPSSMAERSFQAVYRTSLTGIQVLMITACFFGLYLKAGRHPAADLFKGLFGGFMLWGFLNTREDALWIMPFVVAASLLILGRTVKGYRQDRKKRRAFLIGGLSVILSLLIIPSGNAFIRHKNLDRYGLPLRLECSDGTFAGALSTMYSIRNKEPQPLVSVSREKLERFYEVSPALASIRDSLDEKNNFYDQNADRHKGDGEVEDGWFLWSLKLAAFNAGRTESLTDSEAFFGQVDKELQAAIEEPSSDFQTGRTMPSPLMSPLQSTYPKKTFKAFLKALKAVAAYQNVGAVVTSPDSGSYGTACAALTREKVFYEEAADRAANLSDAELTDRSRAVRAAERVNRLAGIYGKVFVILLPLAGLAFTILLLYALVRKRQDSVSHLLVTAGLMLTGCVDLIGIAYTDISAFNAIRCDYLAGVYPLALAFAGLVLFKSAALIILRKSHA